MNLYKKNFLKNAIVIPIVISVAVTALFFVSYSSVVDNLIYSQKVIALSDYSDAQLSEAQEIGAENDIISKGAILPIKDNTIIADADINGYAMKVVYMANELNSSGNLCLNGNIVFGERGTCYLYCNKKDNKDIRMLNRNDIVNIDAFYGDCSYRVVEITECENEMQLNKVADNLSSALVIYTDSNTNIGLDNRYCAVVCEMLDGVEVTQ